MDTVEGREMIGGVLPLGFEGGDAFAGFAVLTNGCADLVAAVRVEIRVGEERFELAELGGLAVEVALDAANRVAALFDPHPLAGGGPAPILRGAGVRLQCLAHDRHGAYLGPGLPLT